jgi:hypothetical protein
MPMISLSRITANHTRRVNMDATMSGAVITHRVCRERGMLQQGVQSCSDAQNDGRQELYD